MRKNQRTPDLRGLERAEEYVRDQLRGMGQPHDAENAAMVRRLALEVLRALPTPKLIML